MHKSLDIGFEVHMIGLDFTSAFDCAYHYALIFKLRQMGIGGTALNIIIEFLTGKKNKRMVVDGQCNDYRNVISGVLQGSVLGPLLFILYASDMWSGPENRPAAYADDVTLSASVPSLHMRPFIAESLNGVYCEV